GDEGQALEEVSGAVLRPRDHDPAGAVPADPVGLGQAAEGQAQHVVAGEGGGVVVHGVVEQDLLVDLVAEEHQVVLARQVREPLHGGLAVDGAGGVDRKSTRLNSSHVKISYAVFCLKKKKLDEVA